jgi:hypothetical protein
MPAGWTGTPASCADPVIGLREAAISQTECNTYALWLTLTIGTR